MITLFAKSGCQYCAKVLASLDEHGLSFMKMNIADESVAEELMRLGGKKVVPYIVDGDVSMYESDDIVSYIEKTYGGTSRAPASELKIQTVGGACQT